MFKPIERVSAVDAATKALRDQILNGVLQPGEVLPTEAALGEALGVSRSTVREALARLASAGLVQHRPGAGRTVLDVRAHGGLEVLSHLGLGPDGQVNTELVRSVGEACAALAPDIAALAALRRTPAELARIEAAVAAMTPELDAVALSLASAEVWDALVDASHNLVYRLAFNTFLGTYQEGRAVLAAILEPELRGDTGHRQLAEAVAAARAPAARSAASALMERLSGAVTRALPPGQVA